MSSTRFFICRKVAVSPLSGGTCSSCSTCGRPGGARCVSARRGLAFSAPRARGAHQRPPRADARAAWQEVAADHGLEHGGLARALPTHRNHLRQRFPQARQAAGLAADHAIVAGHGACILQPVHQLQQAAEVRHCGGDGDDACSRARAAQHQAISAAASARRSCLERGAQRHVLGAATRMARAQKTAWARETLSAESQLKRQRGSPPAAIDDVCGRSAPHT